MKNISKRLLLVNGLGAVGYVIALFTWVLFIGMLILTIGQSGGNFNSAELTETITTTTPAQQSLIALVVGYSLVAIMGLASLIVLLTFPYFIGKYGAKGVRLLQKLLRLDPTRRQQFFIKCIVATTPVLGFTITTIAVPSENITIIMVHFATIIGSILAMVCFFVQLLLARRYKVTYDHLW